MSDEFLSELSERFADGVWKFIPSEDDLSWVEECSREPFTTEPSGDLGELVREFRSAGISDYAIARFAKLMCYDVAFSTLYYLGDYAADGRGALNDREDEWHLVATTQSGTLIGPIRSPHAFLIGGDPSGREMRPK